MKLPNLLFWLSVIGCAVPYSYGSVIYSYSGNNFQELVGGGVWATTSQHLTGWIEVAAPIAAGTASYIPLLNSSLSDGVHTFGQFDPNVSAQIYVETDAGGNFTAWSFVEIVTLVEDDGFRFELLITNSNFGAPGGSDRSIVQLPSGDIFGALNQDTPGKWALLAIPEPPSFALAAAGGLLLLASTWKRPED